MSSWTADKVATAKKLRRQGKSGSQIAAVLGPEFNRCMVNRKLHAEGVEPVVIVGRKAKAPSAKIKPPTPVRDTPAPNTQPRKRITVASVKEHHCRWPIGDPRAADFHFCGNDQYTSPTDKKRKKYCQFHYHMSLDPRRREEIKAPKFA